MQSPAGREQHRATRRHKSRRGGGRRGETHAIWIWYLDLVGRWIRLDWFGLDWRPYMEKKKEEGKRKEKRRKVNRRKKRFVGEELAELVGVRMGQFHSAPHRTIHRNPAVALSTRFSFNRPHTPLRLLLLTPAVYPASPSPPLPQPPATPPLLVHPPHHSTAIRQSLPLSPAAVADENSLAETLLQQRYCDLPAKRGNGFFNSPADRR